MTDLETLRQWLRTYPGWGDGELPVDYADGIPDSFGLYPGGLEELSRQEDVMGNVTVEYRYHFTLHRITAGQGDNTAEAAWLLDFQHWVQQQSILGLAPHFGDVPYAERLRAQKGELKEASQAATATYTVTLTADFIKNYGGNGNV